VEPLRIINMGRIEFRHDYQPTTFRKVAFGTWKTAADPSVYGQMELDMSRVLAFTETYSKEHNVRVTPTHLFAYVVSRCMKKRPEINGMIRGYKIYLRKHVSLFFQVNVPGDGHDKTKTAGLSGTTLDRVEEMDLKDIASALDAKAKKLKSGNDEAFNKSFNMIKLVPWWFVRQFLDITSFLVYGLNLDLSIFGIPKDPFGSAMITNVGSMGIDLAWAPLCPYTRVPILMAIGAMHDRVIAVHGKPEVRPVIQVGITFDHRFMDGAHAADMSKEFKKYFADPEANFT
jgi:pyruvate dehydrogenase E2 component (dihydrolipoamide acetyltransferase)